MILLYIRCYYVICTKKDAVFSNYAFLESNDFAFFSEILYDLVDHPIFARWDPGLGSQIVSMQTPESWINHVLPDTVSHTSEMPAHTVR